MVARSRIALGFALFGSAAWPAVFCPAATPAADATRIVTVELAQRGWATWSTTGADARATLVLRYRWRGELRFAVPAAALARPSRARFAVSGATVLRAAWTGRLSGTRLGVSYRCRYAAKNVPGRVTAVLSNGSKRGRLRLVLRAQRTRGFFPAKGYGASVSCTSPVGAGGPTHFEPAWLFRDNLQDHDRLTSDTAVISVPSTVLPDGSATITFPHEVGTVELPLRPKLTWANKGRLSLRAR